MLWESASGGCKDFQEMEGVFPETYEHGDGHGSKQNWMITLEVKKMHMVFIEKVLENSGKTVWTDNLLAEMWKSLGINFSEGIIEQDRWWWEYPKHNRVWRKV